MQIRAILPEELPQAQALVWKTFLQFEAPDYSDEGVRTFENSVMHDKEFIAKLRFYGAFEAGQLWGVLATRGDGSHIALFFVDGSRQRQGVGRKLFEAAAANSRAAKITVNSSPYAVEIYHRLGFFDTAPEQTTDGMRYTPMAYHK